MDYDDEITVNLIELEHICKLYSQKESAEDMMDLQRNLVRNKYGKYIITDSKKEIMYNFLKEKVMPYYSIRRAKKRLKIHFYDIFRKWLDKLGKTKTYNLKTTLISIDKPGEELILMYAQTAKGICSFTMRIDFRKKEFYIKSKKLYQTDKEIEALIYRYYEDFKKWKMRRD